MYTQKKQKIKKDSDTNVRSNFGKQKNEDR